jgi:SAM-dependent methyltransferase
MQATPDGFSVAAPRVVMRAFYYWRYLTGKTPWDTNITPPELVKLVEDERMRPGRALDLGCGTGTNAIFLAQHGFDVIGVDYVGRAIDAARKKAQASGVQVEFRRADVLAPGNPNAPLDLILDIGCFHSLDPGAQVRYAANTRSWTRPNSVLLMYAFFPFHALGRAMGVARKDMERLFAADFVLREYADDGKSAWYRWVRK